MKFFKKLKSSNFWVSMISAVVLILQAVFNVEIKAEYLSQIIMAMLGLLVMSGIVTDTPNGEVTIKQDLNVDEIKNKIDNIFTQSTSILQTNLDGIVKIFEAFSQSANQATLQSNQEVANTEITTDIKIEPEVMVEKTEEEEVEFIEANKLEDEPLTQSQVIQTETAKVQNLNVL